MHEHLDMLWGWIRAGNDNRKLVKWPLTSGPDFRYCRFICEAAACLFSSVLQTITQLASVGQQGRSPGVRIAVALRCRTRISSHWSQKVSFPQIPILTSQDGRITRKDVRDGSHSDSIGHHRGRATLLCPVPEESRLFMG